MASETAGPPELSWTTREALAGEIIGATIELRPGPGRPFALTGTVVDESLSTLSIRVAGRARPLRLAKSGLAGTVVTPSGELPLSGELLRTRPEDRTKRLLAGGRRRPR